MTEKQAITTAPFVLLFFGFIFAFVAKHSADKISGKAFDLQNDLYIPAVFFIAGMWSIVLISKSSHSNLANSLLILVNLAGVALAGFALFEEVHP